MDAEAECFYFNGLEIVDRRRRKTGKVVPPRLDIPKTFENASLSVPGLGAVR
jgi:hypothetical protein